MRTPLNTIQIGVELIKPYTLGVNRTDIVDMYNSCRVAEWTLDNLLTYNAILSNTLVLKIANVNIWEYLNNVLGDMPIQVHIIYQL
jgi:signal transduction histidine kinase